MHWCQNYIFTSKPSQLPICFDLSWSSSGSYLTSTKHILQYGWMINAFNNPRSKFERNCTCLKPWNQRSMDAQYWEAVQRMETHAVHTSNMVVKHCPTQTKILNSLLHKILLRSVQRLWSICRQMAWDETETHYRAFLRATRALERRCYRKNPGIIFLNNFPTSVTITERVKVHQTDNSKHSWRKWILLLLRTLAMTTHILLK